MSNRRVELAKIFQGAGAEQKGRSPRAALATPLPSNRALTGDRPHVWGSIPPQPSSAATLLASFRRDAVGSLQRAWKASVCQRIRPQLHLHRPRAVFLATFKVEGGAAAIGAPESAPF